MPLSAGRHHEMNCEVLGSDPPPKVEWWLGDVELTDFTQKVIFFMKLKFIYLCGYTCSGVYILCLHIANCDDFIVCLHKYFERKT